MNVIFGCKCCNVWCEGHGAASCKFQNTNDKKQINLKFQSSMTKTFYKKTGIQLFTE